MSAMTREQIEQLLADNRTRGGYLDDCTKFFASGELSFDFSQKYPGKESGTLRNSINQNAKKVENHPEFQILMVPNGDKKHVLLVNMDVYHSLGAQANEQ